MNQPFVLKHTSLKVYVFKVKSNATFNINFRFVKANSNSHRYRWLWLNGQISRPLQTVTTHTEDLHLAVKAPIHLHLDSLAKMLRYFLCAK